MRYVADVLKGLDPYRKGGTAAGSTPTMATPSSPAMSSPEMANSITSSSNPKSPSVGGASSTNNSDDDDDDMFGGDGQNMLDISIDATALSAASAEKKEFGAGAAKRRRSSAAQQQQGSTRSSSSPAVPVTKKPKTLNTQNFLDLFQSIDNLDRRYKSSLGTVESIPPSYLDEANTDIDDLVGDELTDMYKKICQTQRNVRRERRTMYNVAVQRRELEKEAKRYVSWLKNLAQVDNDDIEFCDKLEKKLDMISVCHDEAKSLRDKRRADDAQKLANAAANAQREAEKEERNRILYDAKMEAEAKPGMVWNKETREYEYLPDPTAESWRD